MALICSFRKRKELTDSTFKEEYVIPQLFTQILKSKNYKGICYYSTKPFEAYSYSTTDTNMPRTGKNMLYKENFVFFTNQNYNSQESFDLALYDSFEISMPSSVGNETRITGDNLDELVETIRLATKDTTNDGYDRYKEKSDNSITLESLKKNNENRLKKAQSIIQFYNEVFVPLHINGKKYNDTDIGIMHKRFLTGILNRLLVNAEIDNNGGASHAPVIIDEHKDDTKVELCNIFGESKNNEFVMVAHKNGLLHKAQIVFIIAEVSNGIYKIASKNQGFGDLVYLHSTDVKNVILDMHLPIYIYNDKKQIGQFLNKECHIEGQDINALSLIENFEVVEVYVSYFKDELSSYPDKDDNTLEWSDLNIKILENKLKSYNGNIGNLWIQALAILAKYLYKDNLKG